KTLYWPKGDSKCPTFREPFRNPYNTVVQQPGKPMPFEFRNRKLTSRFVAPYLRICIHGHLAHLRSTVPGIPDTHSLYSPRARYSRTSRPKEGLPGPQQALLLAGHASVN